MKRVNMNMIYCVLIIIIMILVIKCFISNKTKEGFRPLLATEMKCANCKDGATKLVGGRCQDWCSKFGYCGATAAHKAGGTDCSQWFKDQQLLENHFPDQALKLTWDMVI